MQFRDLKAQYQKLKSDIDTGIAEVIENTRFISGNKVVELEEKLAAYTGRKHCISCANGTDALELALKVLKIGSGDAVFVPSFTFMSTAEVVSLLDARPIFVDIDLETFNISARSLENAIEKVIKEGKYQPKAIIPVDLFGLPADFDKIIPIAKKYGLKIIEDGAQGFGGAINGKKACSFGDISTTSFFPAKPLGCYGDGGAIFTDNDDVNVILRSLCVHGKGREKYENIRIGRNSRLDTIQAAILLPKLSAFAEYEVNAVNEIARNYTERLSNIVITPNIPEGFLSSYAQYTVLCKDAEEREVLQNGLKERGIPSMIYYPCGLHLQKAFAYCGYSEGSLPYTENACKRVLSLPMHPYMSITDIDAVCAAIKEIIK